MNKNLLKNYLKVFNVKDDIFPGFMKKYRLPDWIVSYLKYFKENLLPRKALTITFLAVMLPLFVYFSTFLIIYFHKRLSTRSEFIVPFIRGSLLIFIAIWVAHHELPIMHIMQSTLFGSFCGWHKHERLNNF